MRREFWRRYRNVRSPNAREDVGGPHIGVAHAHGCCPAASATSDDPQVVAESLKAQIPQIAMVIKVTEANDSNNLIGRPGKYDDATFMKDTRVTCTGSQLKDLATNCGAKVERWPSKADAQARADFIQKAFKAMPILGTEYDYVRDGLILRVAGDLKPSQAKQYETAFMG